MNVSPRQPYRFPYGLALIYGLGCIGNEVAEHGLTYLVNPLYCVTLGVSPVVVANILLCTRLVDMFLDPWIANVSDQARTRWGRRMPFIFGGALILLICFLSVFFAPTGKTPSFYAWWLGISGLGFYIGLSPNSIAYRALLPELASDSRERARIMAVQIEVRTVAIFLTVWALPFAQSRFFERPQIGLRVYAAVIALLLVVGTVLMLKRIHERPAPAEPEAKIPLIVTLKQVARIRPVYPVVASVLLFGVSGNLSSGLCFYLLVYKVFHGDAAVGSFWLAAQGTAWLTAVLLLGGRGMRATALIGRKNAFTVCGALCIAALLLTPICYRSASWLLLIPSILIGPAWSVANAIIRVQTADLTEWDELHTGKRREAMITTAVAWTEKLMNTIVVALAGYILLWSGFRIEDGAAQRPGVMDHVMSWYVALPGVLTFLSILINRRYHITEREAGRIRAELARSRELVPIELLGAKSPEEAIVLNKVPRPH